MNRTGGSHSVTSESQIVTSWNNSDYSFYENSFRNRFYSSPHIVPFVYFSILIYSTISQVDSFEENPFQSLELSNDVLIQCLFLINDYLSYDYVEVATLLNDILCCIKVKEYMDDFVNELLCFFQNCKNLDLLFTACKKQFLPNKSMGKLIFASDFRIFLFKVLYSYDSCDIFEITGLLTYLKSFTNTVEHDQFTFGCLGLLFPESLKKKNIKEIIHQFTINLESFNPFDVTELNEFLDNRTVVMYYFPCYESQINRLVYLREMSIGASIDIGSYPVLNDNRNILSVLDSNITLDSANKASEESEKKYGYSAQFDLVKNNLDEFNSIMRKVRSPDDIKRAFNMINHSLFYMLTSGGDKDEELLFQLCVCWQKYLTFYYGDSLDCDSINKNEGFSFGGFDAVVANIVTIQTQTGKARLKSSRFTDKILQYLLLIKILEEEENYPKRIEKLSELGQLYNGIFQYCQYYKAYCYYQMGYRDITARILSVLKAELVEEGWEDWRNFELFKEVANLFFMMYIEQKDYNSCECYLKTNLTGVEFSNEYLFYNLLLVISQKIDCGKLTEAEYFLNKLDIKVGYMSEYVDCYQNQITFHRKEFRELKSKLEKSHKFLIDRLKTSAGVKLKDYEVRIFTRNALMLYDIYFMENKIVECASFLCESIAFDKARGTRVNDAEYVNRLKKIALAMGQDALHEQLQNLFTN